VREAELASQLGSVNARLSEAQAASHTAERAREETAAEREAAALALMREAEAKAGLTVQLAQATAGIIIIIIIINNNNRINNIQICILFIL
jgi:hypothetical protein